MGHEPIYILSIKACVCGAGDNINIYYYLLWMKNCIFFNSIAGKSALKKIKKMSFLAVGFQKNCVINIFEAEIEFLSLGVSKLVYISSQS